MVIYELYVDKFARDFKGLAQKLSYLRDLGITHIWLLPHYPSPMVDDGYDVSDYYGVRKELGTIDDFKLFLDKANEFGIGVLVDWVINHTSVEHPWFKEASSSKNNSKRDFYIWSKDGHEFLEGVNAFPQIKKSNWIYNGKTRDYYYATFYPQQADLNWENQEVFDEMRKFLGFWLDLGVSGFRVDAVPYLVKEEGTNCKNRPGVHKIMKRFRRWIDKEYPGTILLAEASGTFSEQKEYFGSGDEFDLVFNFSLREYLFYGLASGDYSLYEQKVNETFAALPKGTNWATVLINHDEVSAPHLSKKQLETLLDTIDPTGRYRFRDDGAAVRLMTAVQGDEEKFRRAFELLFSTPGVPVIYYGEELGLENMKLKGRPLDTRRYVRQPFDWELASQQMVSSGSMFKFVKELISKHQHRT